MSRKVSDEFTVPVCRTHDRELHTQGDERVWWNRLNIDPLRVAAVLWNKSHDKCSTNTSKQSPMDDRSDLPRASSTIPLDGRTMP